MRKQVRVPRPAATTRHQITPKPTSRTLTVTEAATILGISRTTAYECVNNGSIPSIRLGGRIVIPRATFDELLEPARITTA